MNKDVKTVEATVFSKTDSLIIALAADGLFHKLDWNGRVPVYRDLKPGDVVMVHYYPGFDGKTVAFEVPAKTSQDASGCDEGMEDDGYEP